MRVRLKALKPKDYSTEPTTLGGHLLKRRMELGFTQPEAAVLLGVSSATVLGWERRGRMPVIAQYPAVIRFLGFDPVQRSVKFRILANVNCGYRGLEPGLPKR